MPTHPTSINDLIESFYRDVWNAWSDEAARRLLHPHLTFRGSLGRRTQGLDEFLAYVAEVRAAFPDFHNKVTDLVAQADRVAARLTYTGTHRGEVLGYPPTRRRIEYGGMAWFTVEHGRIRDGYVLGDVESLRAQLRNGAKPCRP